MVLGVMSEIPLFKVIVWAILGSVTGAAKIERMVVSKMRMSDLETSGSGYAYSHQQGLPASYIRYTNHGGHLYYDASKPVHYVSSPVAHPTIQQQHELINLLYPDLSPAAYIYSQALPEPIKLDSFQTPTLEADQLSNYEKFQPHDSDSSESEEEHGDYKAMEDSDESVKFRTSDKWRPGDPHAGHDVAYVNDAGETYDAAKYSAHGVKGEKGYKTRNEFDEGESAAHFEDNHKGHYNDEGGHEKARSETTGNYAQHGEEEKGAKGTNYGQVKYHKKGHKTSGFHNVYHKDEYKKDTDFYDEKHESGNFEKYGSNDEQHRNIEGAFKKGLRHDSAYDRRAHANEGKEEKGRSHQHRKGHSHKKGDDSFHHKEAEFAKTAEKERSKEVGYRDKHDIVN